MGSGDDWLRLGDSCQDPPLNWTDRRGIGHFLMHDLAQNFNIGAMQSMKKALSGTGPSTPATLPI